MSYIYLYNFLEILRGVFLLKTGKKTFSVVLVAISEFFKYKTKNNDKDKNNKTVNRRKQKFILKEGKQSVSHAKAQD